MKYNKSIVLKNGKTCVIRNADANDAEGVYDNFNLTHGQTDFLMAYAVGRKDKIRHRADFGIGIEKDYWGLGIGRVLTEACIESAKKAGYAQLELEVVADNKAAISLYQRVGFCEYGRNPMGFRSRNTGWQELVLMRLVL